MHFLALQPQPLGTMGQPWKPGSKATAWRGHLAPARTIAAAPAETCRSLAAPQMHRLLLATAGALHTVTQICAFTTAGKVPMLPTCSVRDIILFVETATLNRVWKALYK